MHKLVVRLVIAAFALGALIIAFILGRAFLTAGKTIFDLLRDNRELRQAIANLTAESQIGYAKVVAQAEREGRLYTKLRFVETAPDDPAGRILEKEYEIEGDIVHFDALIVKFSPDYVKDGRGRALYLWRRVYGEKMTPEQGFPIESENAEPARYREIFRHLPVGRREMFWTEIWRLSNDPDRLKAAGIKAIDGAVVYKKLAPNLIYVFKINALGGVDAEVVPAL